MIVKANVVDKESGLRTEQYFLVRFDHTPITSLTKKKRRTGVCTLYYLNDTDKLTDANDNVLEGSYFNSKICGEKFKFYVGAEKIVCHENDNYVKAFARTVTLQKMLNWYIMNQDSNPMLNGLPFKFDNTTFKSFMTALNEQHPHGQNVAMELLRTANYRTK